MKAYKKENRTYIIISIHRVLIVDSTKVREIWVHDTDDYIEELKARNYTEIEVIEMD